MPEESINWQVPEERELEKKISELEALQTTLAERELELATLQAELRTFEKRYLLLVGSRYAKLDEIEAQIAEALAVRSPRDHRAQEEASHARSRAQKASQAASIEVLPRIPVEFRPADRLKKLYREIAKLIHPDLANDEDDRNRRHQLMAEANKAYVEGDEPRLQSILQEWKTRPESVPGIGPGAELVRVIRKIALVESRLRSIEAEMAKIKKTDLFQLSEEVRKAEREGRDLLSEMSEGLDRKISAASARLSIMTEKDEFVSRIEVHSANQNQLAPASDPVQRGLDSLRTKGMRTLHFPSDRSVGEIEILTGKRSSVVIGEARGEV